MDQPIVTEGGYEQPEDVMPVGDALYEDSFGTVPQSVEVAFAFIRHCNENMGYRCWHSAYNFEERQLDLHPRQEGAFSLACMLLGTYFAEQTKGMEHGHGRGRTDEPEGADAA